MDTFVAFDLETTGLDYRNDEIIEIGAARVEGGVIVETFSQLVCPRGELSLNTRRVTGIAPADLAGKPDAVTAVRAFRTFAGDLPLVAHNAEFDETFLIRFSPEPIGAAVYDSLELARLAMPLLPRHDLESLVDHFGLADAEMHRAESDARMTAQVWLRMIDALDRLPLAVLSELAWIVDRSAGRLKPIVLAAEARARARHPVGHEPIAAILKDFTDQVGKRAPKRPAEPDPVPLDPDAVVRVLESDGMLHEVLDPYERRPEQIAMARKVAEAINDGAILAVEAGTGTGKSMAYLVPAVEWARRNGEKVVVSTNTKNLQDQLVRKDIPLLEAVLGHPIRTAVAKGRSNYLCVLKLFGFLRDLRGETIDEGVVQFLPVLTWAAQTAVGDISEHGSFLGYRSPELWGRLTSTGDDCAGRNCTYYNNCFLMKARQAVQEADVIVANHSVVFSDIATDNALLPDHAYLIFDEAHNIEHVATEQMRIEIGKRRAVRILSLLYRPSKREHGSGLLPQVLDQTESIQVKPEWKRDVAARCSEAVASCRALVGGLDELDAALGRLFGRKTHENRIRYRREGRPADRWDPIRSAAARIAADIGALARAVTLVVKRLTDLDKGMLPFRNELAKDLEGQAQQLTAVADDLATAIEAARDQYVFWVERVGSRKAQTHLLCAAPLDIAPTMKERLYDKKTAIVLTSATLSVNGSFDFLLGRLGLDRLPEGRVRTAIVGSSFDYDAQTLVTLPTFLPEPTDTPAFEEAVARMLVEVHHVTRGRGLVLFTSYGMLKDVTARVKPALESEGILVLAQGVDGSRRQLTETFREEIGSVLMATSSFWEGVDVPGESLSCLTLIRLPFQVVNDPVIAARCEWMERQGLDPFLHYSVPSAVIKFRQGFGRLIRARTDRGVVIVADKRASSRRYGAAFLQSLPTRTVEMAGPADLLRAIGDFLGDR